ncbi:hypothetical protein Syun_010711 [Stephania yunnanensis]|uniref:Uncharacterized protein n=1 Tax=Stephania yunnanensis TaxID=152371 RepID=A0AAP0KJB6_9MAGN
MAVDNKKISTLILKVDLNCTKCYNKIRKVLCQFRCKIVSQTFDMKKNLVIISGFFDPNCFSQKLRCKAGKVIISIEIVKDKPPPPPPKKVEPTPPPPKVDPLPPPPKVDPLPPPPPKVDPLPPPPPVVVLPPPKVDPLPLPPPVVVLPPPSMPPPVVVEMPPPEMPLPKVVELPPPPKVEPPPPPIKEDEPVLMPGPPSCGSWYGGYYDGWWRAGTMPCHCGCGGRVEPCYCGCGGVREPCYCGCGGGWGRRVASEAMVLYCLCGRPLPCYCGCGGERYCYDESPGGCSIM